jgi:putative transcription factor
MFCLFLLFFCSFSFLSSFQIDWEPVVLKKKSSTARKDQPKGDAAIAVAARTGQHVDSEKKHAASTNKQHGGPLVDARKLEDPDSTVKLKTVSVDLKNQIQQARQAKGLSQKELANKINEKQTIVAEYESGKAIPDQKILSKMSKALGVQLKK